MSEFSEIVPSSEFIKVLLIEDDPVTRWMVRLALKKQCYLATSKNAEYALDLYHGYKPHFVLLDINLPGMDGKAFLQRLMRIDPQAYVVMFSSQNTAHNIEESINSGAKGFISKPFTQDILLEHISTCIDERQVARRDEYL